MKWEIRSARQPDLTELTAIYNHHVVNTAITFDTRPFSPDERVNWFVQFNQFPEHLLLVATLDDKVVGYADQAPYSCPYWTIRNAPTPISRMNTNLRTNLSGTR